MALNILIIKELIDGWKDVAGRARTVAMSLSKNTAIFHRLPSGTFGLKKWYGDAIEKKKAKKDGKESEAEQTDQ